MTATAQGQAPGGATVAVPGRQVTYTFTVSNAGPSDASAVRLVPTVPAGATVVSASGTGWTCTTGPLVCTRPALADGADTTVTVVVTLAADTTGDVTGAATVSSGSADDDLTDNGDSATLPTRPYADLVTTKTISPNPPVAGAAATYTVTVRNDGPSDAPGVVITDPLQDGQSTTATPTLTGADGTCSVDAGGDVTCTLDDPLPAGASATVSIPVTFGAGFDAAAFTNSATASSTAAGQTPGENIGTVSGPSAVAVDLVVGKTGPATAAPGGTISWDVTVRNDGPSDAEDVQTTDAVPDAVTVTGVTASGAATDCTVAAVVSCTTALLTSGMTLTVTITGRIASGATDTLVNRASAVSANAADTDTTDNTSSDVTTRLVPAATLEVTKTASPLVAGHEATYTIAVADRGPSDAEDVVVTDAMPDAITATAATVGGGTCTVAATVRCELGTITSGSTATVTITVTVDRDAAGTITNTATATSPTASGPARGRVTSPVTALVDLSVTKTADRKRAAVGDEIRYRVTVTNDGRGVARGVVVDDRLPAGLRYVSSEADRGGYDPSTGRWRVGRLAPGASAALVIVTTLTRTGSVVNIARIEPTTPGTTPDTRPDPAAAPVLGVDAASGSAPTPPSGSGAGSDGGGGGSLGETGAATQRPLGIAFGLLGAGLLLLLSGLRRRREDG